MAIIDYFSRAYSFLYFQSWNLGLWTPPDRKFLTRDLFAYYSQDVHVRSILFVGVRRYTSRYAQYFKDTPFVTIDIDATQERYGAKRHLTGNVCDLESWQNEFPDGVDLVFLNGVIGFGLNREEDIERALEGLSAGMNPGATVVFGINPHVCDHSYLENSRTLTRHFTRTMSPISGKRFDLFTFPGLRRAQHEYHYYRRQ